MLNPKSLPRKIFTREDKPAHQGVAQTGSYQEYEMDGEEEEKYIGKITVIT